VKRRDKGSRKKTFVSGVKKVRRDCPPGTLSREGKEEKGEEGGRREEFVS